MSTGVWIALLSVFDEKASFQPDTGFENLVNGLNSLNDKIDE